MISQLYRKRLEQVNRASVSSKLEQVVSKLHRSCVAGSQWLGYAPAIWSIAVVVALLFAGWVVSDGSEFKSLHDLKYEARLQQCRQDHPARAADIKLPSGAPGGPIGFVFVLLGAFIALMYCYQLGIFLHQRLCGNKSAKKKACPTFALAVYFICNSVWFNFLCLSATVVNATLWVHETNSHSFSKTPVEGQYIWVSAIKCWVVGIILTFRASMLGSLPSGLATCHRPR